MLVNSTTNHVDDIHQTIIQWKVYKMEGQSLLTQLCDSVISRTYVSDVGIAMWGTLSQTDVPKLVAAKLELKIVRLNKSLGGVVDCLQECVKNFSNSLNYLKEEFRGDVHDENITEIISTSNMVLSMMRSELNISSIVAKEAAYCENRDTLTLYTAAWMMQPYTNKEIWKDLENLTQ